MGLDMYLNRRTYVKNWDHMNPDELHQIDVKLAGKEHPYIKPEKIGYIEEEVGYWRKANAIHKWFVDNVQNGTDDCGKYYVSWKKLEELLNTCKQVSEDHERAAELLPSQSGFYFGSTEYDDWYFHDIEDTINILEPLVEYNKKIQEDREKKIYHKDIPEYEYHSSW